MANAFPKVGRAAVDVTQAGETLARLEANDRTHATLDVQAGTLEFAAHRIFTAEETGETMDIGGWIAVERL